MNTIEEMAGQNKPDSQVKNPYIEIIQNQYDENSQRLSMSLDVASKSDPLKSSEAQNISGKLGLHYDIVKRNPEESARRLRVIENDHVLRNSPKLAEKYLDTGYAERTFDDTPKLAVVEQAATALKDAGALVVGSMGTAMHNIDAGMWGYLLEMPADVISSRITKPLFGSNDPFESVANYAERMRKASEASADVTREFAGAGKDASYAARMTGGALESVTQSIVTLPVGLEQQMAKGAVAAGGFFKQLMEQAGKIEIKQLLPMGVITAGQSYGEAKDQGVDPLTAALYATSQGAIEIGTERIGLGQLVRDVKMTAPIWKLIRNQLITENVTEQVATHFQDLNDWAVLPENANKTFGDYLDERPSAALDTLVQTSIATLVQTGLMRGTVNSMRKKMSDADKAIEAEQNINEVIKSVADTKSHIRNAGDVESLIQDVGIKDIYIDANAAAEVLNQGQLSKLATDKDIQEAINTGGDLVIPASKLAIAVAQDPSMQSVVEHVRIDPGLPSASEARAVTEQTKLFEKTKEEADKVIATKERDDAFIQSAREVETKMFDQIKATGQYPDQVAKTHAQFIRDWYVTQAAAHNVTPSQFYEMYPYKVSAEGANIPTQGEIKDEQGFVRNQTLSQSEKQVEQSAYDMIAKNESQMVENYFAKNGNVVDPDKVKAMFPEFATNPMLANAVHEPSSYLSRKIFTEALKRNQGKPVLFTAGGSGSGKTESTTMSQEVLGVGNDLIYDSTMSSFNSAKNKIDEALASGSKVAIVYTNRNAIDAFELSLLRDRVVNIVALAKAHTGASNTIRQVADYYKDNPNVSVTVVNNLGNIEDMHFGSIDDVYDYDYNTLERSLYEKAKQAGAEGRISEERLAATVRGSSEGGAGKLQEGQQGQELGAGYTGVWTLKQSVSLRKGSETLKRFGLDPNKKHKTRDIASALEARTREKYGKIEADDRSADASTKIAKWMADEVLFEMQNPEKSGAGWYSEKFQRAIDVFAQEFPELKTDQYARDVLTALIAITSDGQKVVPNFAQAIDIYSNYRKNGKFETTRGHQRQESINNNLDILTKLFSKMTPQQVREYLMQEETVSKLTKLAKESGQKLSTGYQSSVLLPRAAVVFGPKLGAFYANLMGAHGYLTMDRWWSRSFNRYRGSLLQKVVGTADKPTDSNGKKIGLARFKELIGEPDISDDEALSRTIGYAESYAAKKFKKGTEIEKAANSIYKAAFVELEDAPYNAKDRTFMLESVNKAQKLLKRQGHDISIADIQAILWYYEKRLYGELGARQTADISYEEAARRVIASRNRSDGRDILDETQGLAVGEDVVGGEEEGTFKQGQVAQLSTEEQNLVDIIKANGGITLNPDGTGFKGKTGFIATLRTVNVNTAEDVPAMMKRVAKENANLLKLNGVVIGAFDYGEGVSVDLNIVVQDVELAKRIGKENDQISVWDIANNVEIKTGGKSGPGMDNAAAEAFIRSLGGQDDIQDTSAEGRAGHPGGVTDAGVAQGGVEGQLRQAGTGRVSRIENLREGDLTVTKEYGTERTGSVSVIGVHYSEQPRAALSGNFYGTGLEGAEKARLESSSDARLRNRIHFYVDAGNGIRPETGVGENVHAVKLNNLYDVSADPLRLRAVAQAMGMDDKGTWFNAVESAILDAGFDGVYIPKAQGTQGVAVLLGEHRNVQVDQQGQHAMAPAGAYQAPATGQRRLGLMSSEIKKFEAEKDAIKVAAPSAELKAGNLTFNESDLDAISKFFPAANKSQVLRQGGFNQTSTPEFKKWFDGSKIVDDNGKPKIMYHATLADFSEFRANTRGVHFVSPSSEWTSDFITEEGSVLNSGTSLMPVYISAKNPFDFENKDHVKALAIKTGLGKFGIDQIKTGHWSRLEDRTTLLAIKDLGFDGLYVMENGIKNLGVFNSTQIKSAIGNAGTFDATNPNILAQESRGQFNPSNLTTILGKESDYSTFLHESAHFFLTVYADMASSANATPRMKQDMQTLLDWFGVKDIEAWNSMTLNEQRKYHEQFAYNYEIYLFEGKAPSVEMQSMFDKFSAWLRRVYKSIRDELNEFYRKENGVDLPMLTGEVRDVMDRMLASEEQIKQAEQVRGMVPMYLNQEQSGMDDNEWAAYQGMIKEAQDASIGDLTTASVRQMQWLSSAKNKIIKNLQKEHDFVRKQTRDMIAEQVSQEQVYKAISLLRDNESGVKLSTQEVKAIMFGEDVSKLGRMMKSDGMSPDMAAEVIGGYNSGEELILALLKAKPFNEEVDARTDQQMLAEHGELSDPKSIEIAVERALHNEARARFVAVEMRHLAKATQPVRVMLQAAKMAAKSIISGKVISTIKPSDYSLAEARAGRQTIEHIKKGESDQATISKRNQLLNNQLTSEAIAARQEIEKGREYLKKIQSDKSRQRVGADHMDQIDQLLERFELRKITQKEMRERASLAQWIDQQKEMGYEPEISPEMEREANAKSYTQMTMAEFRDLVDTVKQIEHLGRTQQNMLTAAKDISYKAARDEIVASINANAGGRTSDARTPTTELGRVAQSLKRFWASHIKAAIVARVLDGGKDGGPMWEYFIRSANERGDMETKMRAKATEDLTKIMAPIFKEGHMGGKGKFFPSIRRSLNKESRIAIALNMGNAGNIQRLLGGEGWTIEQVMPVMESLTESELHAVQQIWDYFESFRPQIAEKERRLYGKEPEWIDPQQIKIKSSDGKEVTLKGGYYPIKYDISASQRAESHADAEEAKRMLQGAYTSATTRRSFVKGRVEAVEGRPLVYTMAGMYTGINEVVHDLSWHEWLIDANKLIRSQSIDEAIRNQYGPEFKTQLKTWINDVAVGEGLTTRDGEIALGRLRQGISAAGLGFNVMSAFQQITGLSQSIVRVGATNIGRGITKVLSSPVLASKEVNSKSSFMANRAKTQFRELNELRNKIQGQSSAMRKVHLGAYYMMMRMQRMVDLPTWYGAYEKAIGEGNDDARSIALADQAVIDSQGSGMVKDLSSIERGGPALKLFTVFYSYMNTVFNMAVTQTMTAKSKGKLAADYLMLFTVPVVLTSVLKDALTPDGGDDDDYDWEALARKLAAEQLSYLMGMMVIVREFGEAAKIVTGAEGAGRDYSGPAGVRLIADTLKFAKQAEQGEFDDSFRKSAVNLLGDATGLPSAQINKTISGLEALSEGETENPAAVLFGYQKQYP